MRLERRINSFLGKITRAIALTAALGVYSGCETTVQPPQTGPGRDAVVLYDAQTSTQGMSLQRPKAKRPVKQKAQAKPRPEPKPRPKVKPKILTKQEQMLKEIREGYHTGEFFIEPKFRGMKRAPKQAILAYFRAHAWNDPINKKKGTWWNAWEYAFQLNVDLDKAAKGNRRAPAELSDLVEIHKRKVPAVKTGDDYRLAKKPARTRLTPGVTTGVTPRVTSGATNRKAKHQTAAKVVPQQPATKPLVKKSVKPIKSQITPKPYKPLKIVPRKTVVALRRPIPRVDIPKIPDRRNTIDGRTVRPSVDPNRGRIRPLYTDIEVQAKFNEAKDDILRLDGHIRIMQDYYNMVAGGGKIPYSQSLLAKAVKTCTAFQKKYGTPEQQTQNYLQCHNTINSAEGILNWVDKNLGYMQQWYSRIRKETGIKAPSIEQRIRTLHGKVKSQIKPTKSKPLQSKKETYRSVAQGMLADGYGKRDIADILGVSPVSVQKYL